MKALLILVALSSPAWSFDWQGHRGARGLYPENTIGGMKEALKYPVTTLELDVVVSGDNQVVVSHEPWMNPDICLHPEKKSFGQRDHNLYKMKYEEIMRFDCGSKPFPRFPEQAKVVVGKPLLNRLINDIEPILKNLNRGNVSYNIEIKSTPEDEKKGFQPEYKKFADLVVKTVSELLPKDRFTIQSFDWRVLKYLHGKHPDVKLVALREESYSPQEVLKELGFTPAVFSPYFKLLNKEDISFFHSQGVLVIPWTVNSVDEMKKLKIIGVDGIITDYPNLIPSVERETCETGHNWFENKCVSVPKHAVPSNSVPGWTCKPGYVQKRLYCQKIKVPSHAELSEDGRSWQCQEGYERYRTSCRKK